MFLMPGRSFDALKEMDLQFGKQTVENKAHVRDFTAWRNLIVCGMELRFKYRVSEHDPGWDSVEVFGFKANDHVDDYCVSGPAAYDCYVRFLDVAALSQHRACAVAMGQHARLGNQSLLSILPEALFRSLLQPHIPTLEHWDCDKEARLKETANLK